MSLVEKMRKAREQVIELEGHRFTIRRPTDAEVACGPGPMDLVYQYVVGWDLKEIDLFPGGSPVEAAFDAEVWREWVADQPTLWAPIFEAVQKAYSDHAAKLEDTAKN